MLSPPWRDCLESFLRHMYDSSQSEHTVSAYRRTLMHFFRTHDPDRARRRDVEDFLHTPLDARRPHAPAPSPATRNTRRAILHSFYKYAASFPLYTHTGVPIPLFSGVPPTAGVRLSRVSSRYRAFTASDLEKFFAVISADTAQGARDRCLYAFYYLSARRRSEIANMLYGDVFAGVVIDADGTRRETWLYHFRRKGGIEDTAEMPGLVKELLDKYLQVSGRVATVAPDDGLFLAIGPAHGGGPIDPYRPMSGQSILANLKVYCKLAGLDPAKFTIHAFRHASARDRFVAGSDIRDIQQALRHANISTTDVYLRTLMTPADPGIRALEERLGRLLT